jgi:hypothetical protein
MGRLCGLVVTAPGYRSRGPSEYNWGVNGVICLAEKLCVSSDVRTEFLNII